MITVPASECNSLSQDSYDSAINSLQFHRLACSCGRHGCLTIHGYYRRHVRTPEGDLPIRICRVKCSECGATHALLLSSMVPYSRILLEDQIDIACAFEEGSDRNAVCSRNPFIDENNVKSVVRRYRLHWRERLRCAFLQLLPSGLLISGCFLHYSMQFMQIRRTINLLWLSPT